MTAIRRTLGVFMVLAGYGAAAQAPEFSQQYRQRIGGAVQELRQVVAGFDADARAEGRDRSAALADMGNSPDPLVQRRSRSMADTIARAEALETQAARIEQVTPMARPAVVLSYPDPALMAGTWEAFEPALPVNGAGLLWGAFGGIIGWLFAVLFGKALSTGNRKRVVIR